MGDDDQFEKVQVKCKTDKQVQLINETAPIMITPSAKKRQNLMFSDEDCEVGSDDELPGRAASPSGQGLPQYSDYDSDSCPSPAKQRHL